MAFAKTGTFNINDGRKSNKNYLLSSDSQSDGLCGVRNRANQPWMKTSTCRTAHTWKKMIRGSWLDVSLFSHVGKAIRDIWLVYIGLRTKSYSGAFQCVNLSMYIIKCKLHWLCIVFSWHGIKYNSYGVCNSFFWYSMEYTPCHLYFLDMHTSLKACVYIKKIQLCHGIFSWYNTQTHCRVFAKRQLPAKFAGWERGDCLQPCFWWVGHPVKVTH